MQDLRNSHRNPHIVHIFSWNIKQIVVCKLSKVSGNLWTLGELANCNWFTEYLSYSAIPSFWEECVPLNWIIVVNSFGIRTINAVMLFFPVNPVLSYLNGPWLNRPYFVRVISQWTFVETRRANQKRPKPSCLVPNLYHGTLCHFMWSTSSVVCWSS